MTSGRKKKERKDQDKKFRKTLLVFTVHFLFDLVFGFETFEFERQVKKMTYFPC